MRTVEEGKNDGAGEVPRRRLSPEAVSAIVEREVDERRAAAAQYTALGRHDEVSRLSLQIEALAPVVRERP